MLTCGCAYLSPFPCFAQLGTHYHPAAPVTKGKRLTFPCSDCQTLQFALQLDRRQDEFKSQIQALEKQGADHDVLSGVQRAWQAEEELLSQEIANGRALGEEVKRQGWASVRVHDVAGVFWEEESVAKPRRAQRK